VTAGALLGLALRSIRRRALRSLLTALTAAVAVATVFATRALLRGSEVQLEKDLNRLGTRTVDVLDGSGFLEMPGGGAVREPLGPADLDAARAAIGKAGVGAMVTGAWIRLGTASAGTKAVLVPLVAASPDYFRTYDAEVQRGRLLRPGDAVPGAPPVCLLDAETSRALGGAGPGAGILLADPGGQRTVRVAGVLADPFQIRPETHAPDLTASARSALMQVLAFRNVYVPLPEGEEPGALMLMAVADRREEAWKVHDAIERALRAKERGLLVWSRGTWVRSVLELAGDQIAIANVIWGIVLAVALVMIATVTLVGVLERTAEVAVRRAEGATRGQVTGQLLLEGALLALAGGLAGIPLGLLAADRLSTLLTWRPYHSLFEGAAAVGLGVAVGLLAAALPALRASRWVVVEGLRRGA